MAEGVTEEGGATAPAPLTTEVPAPQMSALRCIAAATVGNALEFYDFITYAFFAIQIGRTFFPATSAYASLMLSLATFGAGFLTRPVGGIVIGLFADRTGRKPAMVLSFMMMGGALVALALIPSYAAIGIAAPVLAILARMVQGFALGGEMGPTTAFLLEAAPPSRRGLFTAWQGASQSLAAITAGLVGLVLSSLLSAHALDAWGWRIAFLLGAVTLPFGLWVRRSVPETIHVAEQRHAAHRHGDTGFQMALANARILIICFVIVASGTIGTYIGNYLVTFAQSSLNMPASIAFLASVARDAAGLAAALLGGFLSDRFGRRPLLLLPRFLSIVPIYPIYAWIVESRSAEALIVGTTVLNVLGGLWGGAFYAAFSESVPKRIRAGAIATVYATAVAIFGSTTQPIVTWLLHATGNPMALAWYLLAAVVAGTIAMLFMFESAPVRVALIEPLLEAA
jgi:MFS family permease